MGQWYVRTRGHVSGPFTAGELREMRENGAVGRFDEVSRDGRVWRPLAELSPAALADRPAEPLTLGPEPDPRPEPEPDPVPRRRSRWAVAVLAAVVLVAVLAAVAAALLLGAAARDR